MKILKTSIYSLISLLIFKLMLELGYLIFVSKMYEYSGFTIDITGAKIVESYVLFFIITPLIITKFQKKQPSFIILFVLYVNLYLPLSALYWLANESRVFFWAVSIGIIILSTFSYLMPKVKIPYFQKVLMPTISIIVATSFIVYGYLIITGGLQRLNFNLLEVYETRAAYSLSSNKIIGYLIPWQAYIFNMLVLLIGFYKHNRSLVYFALFLQLLLFGMTNFKSFLFAPIVLIIFYFIWRKFGYRYLIFLSTTSISVFIAILLIVYKFKSEFFLLSIFLRRLFFTPAQLHNVYYDYFSINEKYLLSHSVFENIIQNPYGVSPVSLIAENIFGRDFSPNAGFFADAYLNFGLFGIFLFVVILGFIMRLVDGLFEDIDPIYPTLILVIPSTALVNSAFLTSLWTHGILISILTLYLFKEYFLRRRKNNENLPDNKCP